MQVHDSAQGAPVLALAGISVVKTNAKPCTLECMAFLRKNEGIFGNF
jgi:hypothetical protein